MTKVSIGAKPLPVPAPVWLVGTYDDAGKPNIMTAAWAGICCSKPPCVTVSLRKATYTYNNIVTRQAYTVNVPSASFIRQVDYVGMVSGRDVDKFAKTGLTPAASQLVDAPYVAEFPVVMECKLVATNDLGLHTMFVGEVLDIRVDENLLDENKHVLAERLEMVVYTGHYFTTGQNLGKGFSIGKELE